MASPNFFAQFTLDTNKNNNSDHFIVEDLFDFSNDDDAIMTDATFDSFTGNSADSSSVTVVDSCISSTDPNTLTDIASHNISDAHFPGDLCVPYDDIAELEWLSNFVDESFSSEDQHKMELIPEMNVPNDILKTHWLQSEPTIQSPVPNSEVPVPPKIPAKARSKRTRGPPSDWASRLHILSPFSKYPPLSLPPSPSPSPVKLSEEPEVIHPTPIEPVPIKPTPIEPKSIKSTPIEPKPIEPNLIPTKKPTKAHLKRKDNSDGGSGSDGRRCLHCATDKTPQWRTGPMGPKTLCNACGVRFKSGRLVPEYRPAASPTFVLTKHSNSHRKVLELRRQKETVRAHVHPNQHHHHQQFLQHHLQHQNMMFDVSNGDDYLIHEHVGPDFRHLM